MPSVQLTAQTRQALETALHTAFKLYCSKDLKTVITSRLLKSRDYSPTEEKQLVTSAYQAVLGSYDRYLTASMACLLIPTSATEACISESPHELGSTIRLRTGWVDENGRDQTSRGGVEISLTHDKTSSFSVKGVRWLNEPDF
jgi:hypothetical protein